MKKLDWGDWTSIVCFSMLIVILGGTVVELVRLTKEMEENEMSKHEEAQILDRIMDNRTGKIKGIMALITSRQRMAEQLHALDPTEYPTPQAAIHAFSDENVSAEMENMR